MKSISILFAGFGGQGIQFAGKVASYAGLIDGREVSLMPLYGPETRGGFSTCAVSVSDELIGSPIVLFPDALVAMNGQYYDKFIDAVNPGGCAIVDSSIVSEKTSRGDINACYVPATAMATDHDLAGLANMILIGKLFKETGFCTYEALEQAVAKSVPASRQHLLEPNLRAIKLGMEQ